MVKNRVNIRIRVWFSVFSSIKSELITPCDITVVCKQSGTPKLHVSLLLLLSKKHIRLLSYQHITEQVYLWNNMLQQDISINSNFQK